MKRFIKSAIACIAAAALIGSVPADVSAASKAITVKTQAELNAAIKKGTYTKITIKTTKDVKITIPASKNAAKVAFTVNAPKAKIANKAAVKSLTVANAKSFTEFGKNNAISITDKEVAVTVAKASQGANIKVAAEGAKVKLVANGAVKSVAVAQSDANVVINGTSDSKIAVTVSKSGAKVSTSVPVAVTANKKATIVIAKGADGSTVAANASVKLSVAEGATVSKVAVKSADANVVLVAKGTVKDVTVLKAAEGAKLNINASGKVANVTVNAKADVAVKGTTTEAVKIVVNAADTTVKAETAVDTVLNADAKVTLDKGAEGSKVTTAENVKTEVANNTTEKITITDSTGKESTVDAGGKTETTDSGKTENKPSTGGSTGGNNNGGSYEPETFTKPAKMVTPTAIAVKVVTGSGIKDKEYLVTETNGKKITVLGKSYGWKELTGYISAAYDAMAEVTDNTKGTTTVKVEGVDITVDWKGYKNDSMIRINANGYVATVALTNVDEKGGTYCITGGLASNY